MKNLLLVSLSILTIIFSSQSFSIASPCEKLERVGLKIPIHLGKGEIITECQQITDFITDEELKNIVNKAVGQGSSNPIVVNSCQELTKFPVNYVTNDAVSKYFGKSPFDWNDSDFEKFRQIYFNCRQQNFFKNHRSFDAYVNTAEQRIKVRREEERTKAILPLLEKALAEAKVLAVEKSKKKKQEMSEAVTRKYANYGPEEGWKNLKWGMTINEIEAVFVVDEQTGEKCDLSVGDTVMFLQHFTYDLGKSINFYSIPKTVSTLVCKSKIAPYETFTTGIMLYNGKFFGKRVYVGRLDVDKQVQNSIMSSLKEKFPKGKITYNKQFIRTENLIEVDKKRTLTYPYFEYIGNKIKVFNDDSSIYFYEPGMLNAAVSDVFQEKQSGEKKKQDSLKKLF
ncbi:MAG: hypothetical protein FD159_2025 [Syntrophaceae bacterium]|nr:MAG: hypothetical protein FD159_2025 [Syntrophaceae bacterium]